MGRMRIPMYGYSPYVVGPDTRLKAADQLSISQNDVEIRAMFRRTDWMRVAR